MLTALLLDRLKASAPARIINVSSDAHRAAVKGLDFDDLQANRSYGSFRAYAQSKLANVLFTRELARRLEGSGVAVNAMHPGLVRSRFAGDGDVRGLMGAVFGMMSWAFGLSPAEGAETSIWLASAPELSGRSGGYFVQRRERTVSRARRIRRRRGACGRSACSSPGSAGEPAVAASSVALGTRGGGRGRPRAAALAPPRGRR
jgi:NAD(P)-dependent dehydrogenase (short-subunit alcohol dehydrogenase family)